VPARTRARKRAVDILYEADQRAGSTSTDGTAVTATSVLAERLVHPGAQTALPAYAVEIVEGVATHAERIDEVLATFSQGWTLERMPAVDRAILRMGTWEVLYNADVDDPVAIDDAEPTEKKVWNDYEIRVVDQKYTIIRNGVVINRFTNAPGKESSRDGDPPTDLRQFASGYIGLQNHSDDDRIEFRNIRVQRR